eukprot:6560192-Alexandrium_andersonii.AAC.1
MAATSQVHRETCTREPCYVLSRSLPKATPRDAVTVSAHQRGLSVISISQHTAFPVSYTHLRAHETSAHL